MNLDKRIKTQLDILSCFNIEKAKSFIGQKGYFGGSLSDFSKVQSCYYDILVDVRDNDSPFKDNRNCHWELFIPESRLLEIKKKEFRPYTLEEFQSRLLKDKKKEFRPYTLQEFKSKFLVGQSIMFRKKGEEGCEVYSLLGGYRHDQCKGQTITYIYIGYRTYTLEELFEEYEWSKSVDSDEFKPFGVEN